MEVNDDSVRGALLASKTKNFHGQNWPRACPRSGIAATGDWVKPLMEMRQTYLVVNSHEMQFPFPRIDHNWQLVEAGPASYSTTRRKLAILRFGLGDPDGEKYTLRSPKISLPTAANQMNFEQRELAAIGHWSANSKMPDRYDRSVCASELLLRNTIIRQMAAGWDMAASFHLPSTVAGHVRLGKEVPPTQVPGLKSTHGETTLVPVTTDPPVEPAIENTQANLDLVTSEPPVEPAREDTQVASDGEDLGDIGRIFGEFDSAHEHETAVIKPEDIP